jgi:hypothetical protein
MMKRKPAFLIGKYWMGSVTFVELNSRPDFDKAWREIRQSAIGYACMNEEYVEICSFTTLLMFGLNDIRKKLKQLFPSEVVPSAPESTCFLIGTYHIVGEIKWNEFGSRQEF